MGLGRPTRPMLNTDMAYMSTDASARCLNVLSYEHHEIHSGSYYREVNIRCQWYEHEAKTL